MPKHFFPKTHFFEEYDDDGLLLCFFMTDQPVIGIVLATNPNLTHLLLTLKKIQGLW
jgi:hypothetical protein